MEESARNYWKKLVKEFGMDYQIKQEETEIELTGETVKQLMEETPNKSTKVSEIERDGTVNEPGKKQAGNRNETYELERT